MAEKTEEKLISMKRSPSEKNTGANAPIEATAPDYPYGLCIHLGKEELDKLGMKDLPSVGAEITLTVKTMVTQVSSSVSAATKGESTYRDVNLQITDIGME